MCHFDINYKLTGTYYLFALQKEREMNISKKKKINFHFSSIMPTIIHYGNKGKGPFYRWTLCPGKHSIDPDVQNTIYYSENKLS